MAGASERLSRCAEVPTNNRLDRAPADVMSRVFHPRFLPSAIGLLPASLGSVRNIRPGKSRYIHHEVIYRDIKRQRRRYGEPCNIVSFCQDPIVLLVVFPFSSVSPLADFLLVVVTLIMADNSSRDPQAAPLRQRQYSRGLFAPEIVDLVLPPLKVGGLTGACQSSLIRLSLTNE